MSAKKRFDIPPLMLRNSKAKIKATIKQRVSERIDAMTIVINTVLQKDGITSKFMMTESMKNDIFNPILNEIDEWKGAKLKKPAKSDQEIVKTIGAWWSRVKPAKLASMLFYESIFYRCFSFIVTVNEIQCSSTRLIIFMDIFIEIMCELIKFPRAKPKPLIPHQCLLISSKFKDICTQFIKHFSDDNITWNGTVQRIRSGKDSNGKKVYKYIKNSDRSKNLFNSYINCLNSLKSQLLKSLINDDAVAIEIKMKGLIKIFLEKHLGIDSTKSIQSFKSREPPTIYTAKTTLTPIIPPKLNQDNKFQINHDPIRIPIPNQSFNTYNSSYQAFHTQSRYAQNQRYHPYYCYDPSLSSPMYYNMDPIQPDMTGFYTNDNIICKNDRNCGYQGKSNNNNNNEEFIDNPSFNELLYDNYDFTTTIMDDYENECEFQWDGWHPQCTNNTQYI